MGMQVSHGVLLGSGSCSPDDHRSPHPHRSLHHLLCGSVLFTQHHPAALHRSAAHHCRCSPDHRSHHLPGQIQRAHLRGKLLLHLGVWLRLGRHPPLHRLCGPLLLPAPLRGRADRHGQDQIHLLLCLKTESCTHTQLQSQPCPLVPLSWICELFMLRRFHQRSTTNSTRPSKRKVRKKRVSVFRSGL